MIPSNPKNRDQVNSTCPYCKFKDDRGRLRALISRDVRIVLVTLVLLVAAPAHELKAVMSGWVTSALR